MMATKDTLFSEEKINPEKILSYNEQSRQQEIAEENAKAAEERRNNLQMMVSAVFIVSFIVTVLIPCLHQLKPRTIEFPGLLALR